MRNKFSSNLLKKGLISFAAASLLATSSFGVTGTFEGSSNDFRITMDKTTVEKVTDVVNVIVEVLDENGKVDVLSTDSLELGANSILGYVLQSKVSTATTDTGTFGEDDTDAANEVTSTNKINFTDGKAGFTLYYSETAKVGQDIVRFTLTAEDADGDIYALPSVDKTINVINPSNQATALEILSLETSDDRTSSASALIDDYDSDNTGGDDDANITAGGSFTVKIQALANADRSQATEAVDTANVKNANPSNESNATIFQTSTVSLEFFAGDVTNFLVDGYDENESVATVTGNMVEGVVFVDVPAGTLTKEGYYYMQASTPSTVGDKLAESNDSYRVYIAPYLPTAVDMDFNTTLSTVNDSLDNNGSGDTVLVSLVLADQYSNTVSYNSLDGDTEYVVSYDGTADTNDSSIDYNNANGDGDASVAESIVMDKTAKTLTFGGTNKVYAIDINYTSNPNITITNTVNTTGEAGISISSTDLNVLTSTLTADVYTKELNVSWSEANLSLVAGELSQGFLTIYKSDGSGDALTTTKTTVKIYDTDDNTTVLDQSTAYSGGDGSVSARFTKAILASQIGKITATVAGYPETDQNGTDNNVITSRDINVTGEINASIAASIGLFEYDATDAEYVAVSQIEAVVDRNVTLTTESNNTSVYNGADINNTYYVISLTDIYGNKINSAGASAAGSVIADITNATDLIDENSSVSMEFSGGQDFNITFDTVGTSDISLYSTVAGVEPLTVDVNVSPASTTTTTVAKLGAIQIITGSDYLLTNGELVVTVKTLDDQTPTGVFNMLNNQVSMVLSNPNLVTVTDGNRTQNGTSYDNGDFLNCGMGCSDDNGTLSLSFSASNTVGDLTVTFRNTTGSVTESKTVHIVSSTADIAGAVEVVTSSVSDVSVVEGESVDLTFTVADIAGNPLVGKSVQILSDNAGIASIDVVETTDENGQVTVTVDTAGSGDVHVTATSEGKSSTVTVSAGEAPNMTISSADATIAVGEEETITVTNPARDLTIDDITNTNEEAVTVSLVDGNVVLTANVEGVATITITDGTTSADVSVTVEAAVETTTATTPGLVAGQWNLLGNASNTTQSVDRTGVSVTWTFDGTWGQDVDVPAGQGFWAKADADIADVTGYEFANDGDGTAMPTFTAGTWSLMSATMSETLADVLASHTDATVVWSFTGTWSNDGATTIDEGQGYWVK